MKKKTALIALALTTALVFSTGCASSSTEPNWSIDYSPVSYEPPSDSMSDTESKGEPTFLLCPDGTPVYTSEITSIFTGSEKTGDKHEITLEEAERMAHSGEEFTVVCSGFVYGYFPDIAYNRIDNPEMFKDFGDGVTFHFIGEQPAPSTEYIRFEDGGKIGTLTVKNAVTYFGNSTIPTGPREFSDDPGNFYRGGSVQFDGEVELSGYVSVRKLDANYGVQGAVILYPDGKSCSKLPVVDGYWHNDLGAYAHGTFTPFEGFCGSIAPEFGELSKITVDTGSLKPGDSLVRAAVTIGNIGYEFYPNSGVTVDRFTLNEIKF